MKKMDFLILAMALVILIAVVYLGTVQLGRKDDSLGSISSVSAVRSESEITSFVKESIEQKRNKILEYDMQDNSQMVIQEIEEYLKLIPQDEGIWMLLSDWYLTLQEVFKAEKALAEGLKLNPESLKGLSSLSLIYRMKSYQESDPQLKQEYLSQAQLNIEKALDLYPDSENIIVEAVQIYRAQGNNKAALQAIDKISASGLNEQYKYILDIKNRILDERE